MSPRASLKRLWRGNGGGLPWDLPGCLEYPSILFQLVAWMSVSFVFWQTKTTGDSRRLSGLSYFLLTHLELVGIHINMKTLEIASSLWGSTYTFPLQKRGSLIPGYVYVYVYFTDWRVLPYVAGEMEKGGTTWDVGSEIHRHSRRETSPLIRLPALDWYFCHWHDDHHKKMISRSQDVSKKFDGNWPMGIRLKSRVKLRTWKSSLRIGWVSLISLAKPADRGHNYERQGKSDEYTGSEGVRGKEWEQMPNGIMSRKGCILV